MPAYDHTQRGAWHWAILAVGVIALLAGIFAGLLPLILCGAVIVVASGLIAHLRVWDEGDALRVRFGPLPLLGTRVPYDEIESVEPSRTSWWHGWGVHGWPGAWLVFNLWGYGAVTLHLKQPRGMFRFRRYIIGTDEPEKLAAFLTEKLRQVGAR